MSVGSSSSHSLPTIFTIGHSTHTLDELVAMLKAHEVAAVADVRTVPQSRRVPQFNADALARDLPPFGIEYLPFKGLGGLRKPRPDSPNLGWRNDSFRGYADYMLTSKFEDALTQLIDAAQRQSTVMMCAEAVPWRCHRSLIADVLVVRGWRVIDIMSERSATLHRLTDFAKVDGQRVIYPAVAPA